MLCLAHILAIVALRLAHILVRIGPAQITAIVVIGVAHVVAIFAIDLVRASLGGGRRRRRSEEHTSELQSLMRISYAVFCLKKKMHHKKRRDLCKTHRL